MYMFYILFFCLILTLVPNTDTQSKLQREVMKTETFTLDIDKKLP